jgi:DNA-binding LacI/PurR family transcriptional regulator
MPEARRTTLYDVARHSGVSYQTVSRVINRHPSVSDETRERVQRAIIELDYRPNRAAQSLAGTKSRTLAMVTYGLNNYGPAQMVINIEQACREAGYDLIFTNVSDHHLTTLNGSIEYIRRWDIDGLLLITPVEGMSYDELAAMFGNIPVALIGTRLGSSAPSIVVDQTAGTRQITEHLIDLGHTRFCEISGPLQWFDAQERHDSWLETLQKHGLTPGESIIGDWSAASGYEAARNLLARGKRFTALVVANDQMAIGAIHALREQGLSVPQDISVVGFDDIPEAAFSGPPLTTIRQDFAKLGRQGVEHLIQRIANPAHQSAQVVIEPELIIRQSTGTPTR